MIRTLLAWLLMLLCPAAQADKSVPLKMEAPSVVDGKAVIGKPLAGKIGLEDAVRKKILRRATNNDAEKWINALKRKYAVQNRPPPDIPPSLFNAYVVLKKFTYPAGLYGLHSATFYIPEGVPKPSGNYGHSRVYDFNSITLECSGGGACDQEIKRGATGGAGSTRQSITVIPGKEQKPQPQPPEFGRMPK